MRGATLIVVGSFLTAIFLLIVAVMLWQEARRRYSTSSDPVYILDDAVRHATNSVASKGLSMPTDDVRRILEWEIYYLQMRARSGRKHGGTDIVAGGTDQAVAYIRDQASRKQNKDYPEETVRAVLIAEAEYLKTIGAVGEVAS